ncbi:hypothetical protein [Legionella tucsonensis]|uniref:Uncharacterized protein n=1 Tax=Legionella tucsonensis TaxID=40335 RepID=A0A0W0ZXA7_9GAMM|nr:hypothetical protein [Legionella tucsonensis]KTD73778.1 hypothetical protein Ltuc_1625 [Legionella tucsonensis]
MAAHSLSAVLKYKNNHVIRRYEKDYPHNRLSGDAAFIELMKFFWLAQQHKNAKKINPDNKELKFICAIYPEMSEIDDMWHTFLLFTKDYMSFCKIYFDDYVHHVPNVEEEAINEAQFKDDLTKYLSFIYDVLGEEAIINWFE